MSWKTFVATVYRSFQPQQYTSLCRNRLGSALNHFCRLLLIFVLVSGVFSLPSFLDMPSLAQRELGKLQNISFELTAEGSEAARFGPLIIDLSNENASLKGQGILITKNKIEKRFLPFTDKSSISNVELKDTLNNEQKLADLIFWILLFLAPYLLILLYIYHALKYLVLIFISTSIIIMIVRTAHGDIPGKLAYKAGLYASFFFMLELPLQVFIESWLINTLFPFMLFIVFFLLTLFTLEPEKIHIPKKEYEHLKSEAERDIFKESGIAGMGTKETSATEEVDREKLRRTLQHHRIK